ncbi:MAG: BamA/TamA family outer membrane protein [Spirochaetia bacterium]
MKEVKPRRPLPLKALACVCFLAALPALAWGQYFERNKVQYGAIDFSVLRTEHFQIYHYPQGTQAVMDAARILEQAYAHHADIFGYGIKGLQKVILYDSFIDFEQTNVIPGIISLGEGGVTEGFMHRIVLPLTGTYSENAHVLAHELVHGFQFEKISPLGVFAPQSQPLPLWFIEGQAEYLSLGPDDPLTDMWMRDAFLNKDIPSIGDLASKQNKYFPYRFGDAVWYWIDRGWGKIGMRRFFIDATDKGIPSAVSSALGVKTMADFSARWKGDFTITYAPKIAGRTLPKDIGRTLPGLASGLNLSPVISPDGKYIAVFSLRNLFGLDLSLADAESGRVLKGLATTDSDARYDVLNFIDSAGAWSPDSKSFAFVVERGGKDAVAIVDVPSGRLAKMLSLSVKGAAGLAWSPDGSTIALSATKDAVRDIYLLDPSSSGLERLTSGWHTKLQPAWSPDGKTLAFATDQGAHTDLANLTFQSMNIGLMDMQSRETRIISIKDGAKHINPLFSPDGKSLYFVADTDGYSDLYRYDIGTQQFFRVTSVATGISGLTVLSPCLSMAETSGELVMTIFNNRKYEVHALGLSQAQGKPVSIDGAINAPTLPSAVTAGQAQSLPALPDTVLGRYSPAFSLLAISQVGVGLGVSPFGTSVGGAAALSFADVLGDHEIDTAVQASGSLDSIGAQFDYVNRRNHINWGLAVAHIPQTYYTSLAPPFPVAGADTGILQQVIFQEEADLFAQYPVTINRRWEATAGYTMYWWEGSVPAYYYQNGLLVEADQVSFPTPPPLSLGHAGLAYVGDYSFFGFTSPIRGSRYRFEMDGDAGSTYFLTALGDLREYLFLNPITIAFRALSVGRYLGGADNPTLTQFYLGESDLVRGYEYYSIIGVEGAGSSGNIPQLNRLFGSKIAVVNLELRIPVLGSDQFGLLKFPWLPTELVGFFDGGVAWTENDPPVLAISADQYARVPIFSAGAAVRVNILGAFVVQIYWAWPFERQNIGGSWGFVLEPGW